MTPPRLGHITELDGVRGLAVLVILLLHFYDPVEAAKPFGTVIAGLIHLCAGGVDLFFVLSGFLITRILIVSKGASNYFRAFYARRILRIFPLYFAVLAVFFLVLLPLAHRHGLDQKLTGSYFLWYLVFAQNWMQACRLNDGAQLAHFWTLAIEEQFYLVWPVTVWLLTTDTLRRVAFILIVFVEVLRIALWLSHADPIFLYFNTVTRLDALALGALLSLTPAAVRILRQTAPFSIPVALILAYFASDSTLPILLLVICGSTVAVAASSSGAIFRNPVLKSFGKYSYAIYVFHYLVHGAMVPLATHMAPRVFVTVAVAAGTCVSFGMAWVSWRVLEAPILRLKHYFPYIGVAH